MNLDRDVVAEGDRYRIRRNLGRYRIKQTIRQSEFSGRTTYEIYETAPDGVSLFTYPSGEQRSSLTVEVFHPCEKYGEMSPAEVSWPSTSDKRPALARALADALVLAAVEAERLDAEAGLL